MNIVVIHDAGVEHFKTWAQVKKATSHDKSEFTRIGVDYVLNMTGDTYEISKDIKMIERVASQKVFAKDKFDTANWFQLITLVLAILIYARG